MRRLAPAFALFFLAPLVAEFLLGNLPITMLPMLIMLAPLYGGGALLVRETARRLGRGWPTMLLFAAAYAVIEEGVTTMSLFNPGYGGAHLMDNGFIPALGISGPWTVSVITLHVVWSVSVPIAVAETLAGDRREIPWLGRPGLAVAAVLFVLGCVGSFIGTVQFWPYTLSAGQMAACAVAIVILVGAGLLLGRKRRTPVTTRRAPSPWLLAAGALVAGLAFRLLPGDWNPYLVVALTLVLDAAAIAAVTYWSAAPTWTPRHPFALAAGAMLAYAILGFPQTPMLPASQAIDLTGNTIFAAAAITLLTMTTRRLHRTPDPTPVA